MKTLETVLVLIVLLILLAVLIFALQPLTDARAREVRIQEAITRSHDITWAMRGAFVIAGIAGLIGCGILIEIWRMFRQRVKRVHVGPTGAYPLIEANRQMIDYNPPNVLAFGALATATRLSGMGSIVKALVANSEPLALPEPQTLELTARDITNYDPTKEPHCLIAGDTGSGKSNATRHIVSALSRQYNCQFVICEPGGVDWGQQATATSDMDIANTLIGIDTELVTRQQRLVDAGVQHISQLHDGTPYLFVVVEEAEAILDNLKLMDRETAKRTQLALRDIARMGRKPGIGLIAVTQAALADVFDPHVLQNMNRVLLFRSRQSMADRFRLENVKLTGLPTGTAYSVAHGGFVNFPPVPVPQLPMLTLNPPKPTTNGVGEEMPESVQDSVPVPVYRAETSQMDENGAESGGIPVRVPQNQEPFNDEAVMRYIYNRWLVLKSFKAVEAEIYHQEGGVKFYWVRHSVTTMQRIYDET